jgi:mxaJ protein
MPAGLALLALFLTPTLRAETPAPSPRVLHVTAEPNNLPFSNDRGEGFENKLVDLIARELGAHVRYTWWAQRRGWVRNTLKEGEADIVPGVPRRFDRTLTTAPYYRSTYALVYRTDRALDLKSLDDPALRQLQIGVQMIGDDFANTPPAHALSRRGIVANVHGYTVYGDYTQPNPPARIIDAVLNHAVDVAIVWGPLAGYFSRQHAGELTVVPLPPVDSASGLPFAFDISVGVRKSEPELRNRINEILVRKKNVIDALLAEYGVLVSAEFAADDRSGVGFNRRPEASDAEHRLKPVPLPTSARRVSALTPPTPAALVSP